MFSIALCFEAEGERNLATHITPFESIREWTAVIIETHNS